MSKIKGNNDGPNGRNETYKIGIRKEVPRTEAVKEVKAGKHPDSHVVEINGREYVRDNPDGSKKRQRKPVSSYSTGRDVMVSSQSTSSARFCLRIKAYLATPAIYFAEFTARFGQKPSFVKAGSYFKTQPT